MKPNALALAGLLLALAWTDSGAAQTGAQNAAPPTYVLDAVAAPDRPSADVARDPLRKPVQMVAFSHLKPGDRIADLMPGQGYYTRIFSHVAGPHGKVYAMVPTELAQVAPDMVTNIKALAGDPTYANVAELVQPSAALAPPEPVDIAWTSDNYHDLYGFFGADQAVKFDAAVYRMLKPGGMFIIIDHAANPGAPGSSVRALHRIDEAIVKAQVLAAGFVLDGESQELRNPADGHEAIVFAPAIRGHTDQFVLRFKKPAG